MISAVQHVQDYSQPNQTSQAAHTGQNVFKLKQEEVKSQEQQSLSSPGWLEVKKMFLLVNAEEKYLTFPPTWIQVC